MGKEQRDILCATQRDEIKQRKMLCLETQTDEQYEERERESGIRRPLILLRRRRQIRKSRVWGLNIGTWKTIFQQKNIF